MISIVDYGAGNLRSIQRAIEFHGATTEITSDPDRLQKADAIVLPGVGNALAAMQQLQSTGLADAITQQTSTGTPLLGICLGMQLLFGEQEEGPTIGLGLLPGSVVRLGVDRKIPHMGWNTVEFQSDTPLGSVPVSAYYFVHSYIAQPTDEMVIAGRTMYGHVFPSVVIQDNIWGMQFHPEKSQASGLALLGSWIDHTRGKPVS